MVEVKVEEVVEEKERQRTHLIISSSQIAASSLLWKA